MGTVDRPYTDDHDNTVVAVNGTTLIHGWNTDGDFGQQRSEAKPTPSTATTARLRLVVSYPVPEGRGRGVLGDPGVGDLYTLPHCPHRQPDSRISCPIRLFDAPVVIKTRVVGIGMQVVSRWVLNGCSGGLDERTAFVELGGLAGDVAGVDIKPRPTPYPR